MINRPIEAIRPIHQRDTVVLDERRMRDEIDLYYPSAYLFINDRFCHVKSCKHGGECGKCPAGELRRYAARDADRIGELMKALQGKDNTIAFLRGQVRMMEKSIEGYRATINQLQATINQLQRDIPF